IDLSNINKKEEEQPQEQPQSIKEEPKRSRSIPTTVTMSQLKGINRSLSPSERLLSSKEPSPAPTISSTATMKTEDIEKLPELPPLKPIKRNKPETDEETETAIYSDDIKQIIKENKEEEKELLENEPNIIPDII